MRRGTLKALYRDPRVAPLGTAWLAVAAALVWVAGGVASLWPSTPLIPDFLSNGLIALVVALVLSAALIAGYSALRR